MFRTLFGGKLFAGKLFGGLLFKVAAPVPPGTPAEGDMLAAEERCGVQKVSERCGVLAAEERCGVRRAPRR